MHEVDIERRLSSLETKVDIIHRDMQVMRGAMLDLVNITARLDERYPQEPSKKQIISLGTVATLLSTVITIILQQLGITKQP